MSKAFGPVQVAAAQAELNRFCAEEDTAFYRACVDFVPKFDAAKAAQGYVGCTVGRLCRVSDTRHNKSFVTGSPARRTDRGVDSSPSAIWLEPCSSLVLFERCILSQVRRTGHPVRAVSCGARPWPSRQVSTKL